LCVDIIEIFPDSFSINLFVFHFLSCFADPRERGLLTPDGHSVFEPSGLSYLAQCLRCDDVTSEQVWAVNTLMVATADTNDEILLEYVSKKVGFQIFLCV
jgi:hypothetical protein